MRQYTQITSSSPRPPRLPEFITKLAELDIQVEAPPCAASEDSPWEAYSKELRFYQSIGRSSFHVVLHETPLQLPAILQVLYAMYRHKPVLCTGRLKISELVSPEVRSLLATREHTIQTCNITKLTFAELSFTLNKLKPAVHYSLSREDEALITRHIRQHLYDLVGRGLAETNLPLAK